MIPVLIHPGYRTGLRDRLALRFPSGNKGFPTFWIHAASMGEIQAAWPVVENIRDRFPNGFIIFTTLTLTGRSYIKKRLSEDVYWKERSLVRLMPLDLPFIIHRAIKRMKPDVILLIETELWPNFIQVSHNFEIPIAIVSGRISLRAFRRYRWIRSFLRSKLRLIDRSFMQTDQDAARLIELGAPRYRVHVTGSMKLDRRIEPLSDSELLKFRQRWDWKPSDQILVAGSTRSGEDKGILLAFRSLKLRFRDLRLIIAPRHLDRIDKVIKLLEEVDLEFYLLSQKEPGDSVSRDVILVDTMGQLTQLYQLADLVFVGGSLVPVGGHDLSEPALLGKPVIYGPHTDNIQWLAEALEKAGGGFRITDRNSLEKVLERLLSNHELANRAGHQAREVIFRLQGAINRTSEGLFDLVEGSRIRSIPCLDKRAGHLRWLENSVWQMRGGGLTAASQLGLGPLSAAYHVLQTAKDRSYRVGILRSKKLSRPVISVGNITVGGTGKTPTVIAICRLLLRKGYRPVLLSRGYQGNNSSAYLEVSDGKEIKMSADVVGDEPVLLARKLPGVPIFIGRDRTLAGQAAILKYRPEVLILDDGFQHRRLHRDLDIVLLDCAQPLGNEKILPLGPLREPASHLERADVFLITRVELNQAASGLVSYLEQLHPHIPTFLSRHHMTGCVPVSRVLSREVQSFQSLQGKRAMVVAGIANPDSLLRSLELSGLEVTSVCRYPDHYAYKTEDVEWIEQEAGRMKTDIILTTEKDAVRLELLKRPMDQWWAITMELSLIDTKSWEEQILQVV